MGQWAPIDIADALELLSPDFLAEEVRGRLLASMASWGPGAAGWGRGLLLLAALLLLDKELAVLACGGGEARSPVPVGAACGSGAGGQRPPNGMCRAWAALLAAAAAPPATKAAAPDSPDSRHARRSPSAPEPPCAQVRGHAVATLQRHDDEELLYYLLQLVQALRYEQADLSRLARWGCWA
jgi:hypothetical protein